MLLTKVVVLLTLMLCVLASTINNLPRRSCKSGAPHPLLPARTVFQFDTNNTWLENIAVRSNGHLLLTMLAPTASLYTLKDPYSKTPELSLLHTFDNATSLLGITEIDDDVFAFISATYADDPGSVSAPSTSIVWEVSFAGSEFSIRKGVDLSGVQIPNGITSIPHTSTVLVADACGGDITRCDLRNGMCTVILKDAQTGHSQGCLSTVGSVGVNGVHYRAEYLYWTNSDQVSLFKTRLGRDGYLPTNSTAAVETVGKLDAAFVDDFTEDDAGVFWIAAGTNNTIVALQSDDGSSQVLAGSLLEPTVAGCTAVAFGRTTQDRKTLYVVTNGGQQTPVNGVREPAKVVALDTAEFVY
ncbi:hypothetical protein GGR50DRAFT_163172 [Xylaria sp. CBS 124048]|nr:hypothetical protein GGR50DRAFT_163172 [Xylaria sp. CBS 124048]